MIIINLSMTYWWLFEKIVIVIIRWHDAYEYHMDRWWCNVFIYIYIWQRLGFPRMQLKFIVFQFEKCNFSLCFTVFCVLPITWEYQELVQHAVFQCFLLFFKFINLYHFCFPHRNCVFFGISGFFDRHKNVTIHQRTMGEMHMGLFSLQRNNVTTSWT